MNFVEEKCFPLNVGLGKMMKFHHCWSPPGKKHHWSPWKISYARPKEFYSGRSGSVLPISWFIDIMWRHRRALNLEMAFCTISKRKCTDTRCDFIADIFQILPEPLAPEDTRFTMKQTCSNKKSQFA